MNEQIEKLSDEAYLYAKERNSIHSPNLLRMYTEKFAELLLQDVITTALNASRWHQEMKEDDAVVALCDLVDNIREEYGVE